MLERLIFRSAPPNFWATYFEDTFFKEEVNMRLSFVNKLTDGKTSTTACRKTTSTMPILHFKSNPSPTVIQSPSKASALGSPNMSCRKEKTPVGVEAEVNRWIANHEAEKPATIDRTSNSSRQYPMLQL
ncbi:unnamed protein product [Dibothriocephalus latus]|uniref:Uncharacterized protein n=1 Tax=Dibothriocephalus latus TaxID=60516 RepID=A0A3P7RFC3_DIBLA|nr:unnamed protein product [Dibothriocephalus latus]